MTDASTLIEVLLAQGELKPDVRWLTLVESSGKEHPLSYGELVSRSQAVASALKEKGVKKSDPVILILPTSLEFLYSYWGILLAGGIPVPLYPPIRPHEMNQYANQLNAIIQNCDARLLITTGLIHAVAKWLVKPMSSQVSIIAARDLLESTQTRMDIELPRGHDTALIQYTSGSTGKPKGVELTHYHLLSNIRAISASLDYRDDDVGVSWLPLYHDMGLIGAILSTLHNSIPLVLLAPEDFIRSPKRWLWAIHKYRGTLSAAPNFAYSLCTRKIKDRDMDGLDLSSWRVAINGAEQIHEETLQQFTERFQPYGFSSKAFVPAYGLAEVTLGVAFSSLNEEPTVQSYDRKIFESEGLAVPVSDGESVRWVSVGHTIAGHQVKVMKAEDREATNGEVGEVMVHGPSLMKGYYRQPRATADTLKNGWLRTGDLGFMDKDDLYITGRSKDMMIKGGKNYYPQDIEHAASSVHGVRPGCVSVFGIPHIETGTEEIVLVAETRTQSERKQKSILHEIKKKVIHDTGCSPDRILLVPPGTVAKTSSGKVQRYLCRERYLAGELQKGKRSRILDWVKIYLRIFFRMEA